MKIAKLVMLSITMGIMSIYSPAQKMVSHHFRYEGDSSQQGKLKEVTYVEYSNASSVRLYFGETKLGEKSYLMLEGANGVKQKLDARSLENWHNSSAYFNGGQVKISVYQAAGEPLVRFKINQVKVNEQYTLETARPTSGQQSNIQSSSSSQASQTLLEEIPYGGAVGRLTNGNQVGGAGWIAPNGAIVTSRRGYELIAESGFDIIEFNVPLSNKDISVNHPAPEDQYPLKLDGAVYTSRHVNVRRNEGGPYHLETALGFAVIEALPNSTGLTPGERQKEYFLIALNPDDGAIESTDIDVDIYSYAGLFDVYLESDYSYNFALQKRSSHLLSVKDHVEKYPPDTEEILLYELFGQNIHLDAWSYHSGGPVTYKDTNVAIGVHEEAFFYAGPSIGNGFRHGNFRTSLNDFFTSNGVYVDVLGLSGSEATGEIHKPYTQLADGVSSSSDDAIIYIAKGNYNESITINTPMILKAPVGVVKIGSSEGNNARMGQPPIPAGPVAELGKSIFEEKDKTGFSEILSYPNPFTERTEIQYALATATDVLIKVFDSHGNEIKTLVNGRQETGEQAVVWNGLNNSGQLAMKGAYFIKIHTGKLTKTIRILKQ